MTLTEASKILAAKAQCIRHVVSGTNKDCNYRKCDECNLCYEQGTMREQIEALELAAKHLKNFPTQMSGTFDLVSRQYLLDEYDRQHQGSPGGARKIIEEAPSVTERLEAVNE